MGDFRHHLKPRFEAAEDLHCSKAAFDPWQCCSCGQGTCSVFLCINTATSGLFPRMKVNYVQLSNYIWEWWIWISACWVKWFRVSLLVNCGSGYYQALHCIEIFSHAGGLRWAMAYKSRGIFLWWAAFNRICLLSVAASGRYIGTESQPFVDHVHSCFMVLPMVSPSVFLNVK